LSCSSEYLSSTCPRMMHICLGVLVFSWLLLATSTQITTLSEKLLSVGYKRVGVALFGSAKSPPQNARARDTTKVCRKLALEKTKKMVDQKHLPPPFKSL
ncbi:unnamed protein product, partial [Ectocarpus sp. 12 AP-2014]